MTINSPADFYFVFLFVSLHLPEKRATNVFVREDVCDCV